MQLAEGVRQPLPADASWPEHIAYEYKRDGARGVFMAVGVQPGSRHASVTGHCTKRGSAPMDEHHQEASPILPWSATSARTRPRCALRFLLLRRPGGSRASWSSANGHPGAVVGSMRPRLTGGLCPPVSQPARSRPGALVPGGLRLGVGAQPPKDADPLALHHRRRPRQTGAPVPRQIILTDR